jgi:hypothetical protein
MLGADDTDGIRLFGRIDDAITLHYKVIIYDKMNDVKSWSGSPGGPEALNDWPSLYPRQGGRAIRSQIGVPGVPFR